MTDLFAEVVILGTALDKSLHYSIPSILSERISPGSRVAVELGRRRATGIVLSVNREPPDLPPGINFRPILHALDEAPVIPGDLLDLCRWISRYYFYPLGEMLGLALPPGGTETLKSCLECLVIKVVRLTGPTVPDDLKLSGKSREILRLLEAAGGPVPLRELRKACKNSAHALEKLVASGILIIEEQDAEREAESGATLGAYTPVELTEDQKNAIDEIVPFIENPVFQPFVLYGVTGSGKTEIYVRLIEKISASGRGSLVLVPEIALSTQLEAIFRRRFGDSLAVWHSALPDRERRRQWADLLEGRRSVVLGARSAVLTPVRNLGLIIIDEEHDSSYKQEDRLRYNARDVALMRGKISGVPLVMGSATPSLPSVYRCAQKQFRPLLLPTRVLDRPHPEFEVVDMRKEVRGSGIFSARLKASIEETLAKGRQALLFLNRRGYAKHFVCNACGHALQCISCSVTLTYHKKDDCLRCHFCGWETSLPERCPVCGHAALFSHGFGTERVDKEVKRLFPEARVVRMDRDTMNSRERLIEALDSIRSGSSDILLGTQMVAKGHDFPNITLIGIINADVGLQVPDFRAGETLVQLLIQVAGRAGRGEEPGRVILQTYNPFHFTIESALKMDYDGFCDQELQSRKILQYPPFTRLLKMLVTSPKEDATRAGARLLAALCREKAEALKGTGRHVAVLGPSPAAYVKLKNRFRWQVFVKTWTSSDMQCFVESVLDATRNDPGFRRVQITVDRDPSNEI